VALGAVRIISTLGQQNETRLTCFARLPNIVNSSTTKENGMIVFNKEKRFQPKATYIALVVFFFLSIAHAAVKPTLQAQLISGTSDPTIASELSWDWCDNSTFNINNLPSPWVMNYRKGENLNQVTCSEMKTAWELYDRQLTSVDANKSVFEKIGMASSSDDNLNPYFVLYNRYTGVLRAFLYIGASSNASSSGIDFIVKASVSDGSQVYPTHLMDFHTGTEFPTLGSPAPAVEKDWVIPNPESGKWLVVDLLLTYDPNIYKESDGYETQLSFVFDVNVFQSSSLNLSGKIGATISSSSTSSGSSVQNYLSGAASMLSWAGNNSTVMSLFKNSSDLGNSLTLENDLDGSADFISSAIPSIAATLTTGLPIPSIIAGVSDALSGVSFIDKLLFTSTSSQIQYLNGTLDMQGTITNLAISKTFVVPYSGSLRTAIPLFAYSHPNNRALGLFNLTHKSPYQSAPASDTWKGKINESPYCELLINPNSLGALVPNGLISVKQSSMLSFSFTDPTDPNNSEKQIGMVFKIGSQQIPYPSFHLTGNYDNVWSQKRSLCQDDGYSQTPLVDNSAFPKKFAIGTQSRLKLNDRVQVLDDIDGVYPGNVYSMSYAELGVGGYVGSIYAPQTNLRDRSTVAYLLATDQLTQQNQVTIGTKAPTSSVAIPSSVRATMIYPSDQENPLKDSPSMEISADQCTSTSSALQSDCYISTGKNGEKTHEIELPPGNYNNITLRRGASLLLDEGNYVFYNLLTESGSYVSVLSGGTSPNYGGQIAPTTAIVLNSLSWQSVPWNVLPETFLVYVLSPSIASIQNDFNGTIIMPMGNLDMGTANGGIYKGRFYAQNIEIHQGSKVFRVPFMLDK